MFEFSFALFTVFIYCVNWKLLRVYFGCLYNLGLDLGMDLWWCGIELSGKGKIKIKYKVWERGKIIVWFFVGLKFYIRIYFFYFVVYNWLISIFLR